MNKMLKLDMGEIVQSLKFWLLTCGFMLPILVMGQHNPNDQVKSEMWDVIGGVSFHFVKDTVLVPRYTKNIKSYESKKCTLEGYLVPIDEGWKQTRFMLSTLPINQCFYCGKNGVPSMVLVELKIPIRFTYEIIKIQGVLQLNKGNAMINPPIVLAQAEKL